jgi:hypothetical protein
MATVGGKPQEAPLVIVAAQIAIAEPPDGYPTGYPAIFAVVKHHFAVGGKDGERQRIVIEMAVFDLFLSAPAARGYGARRNSSRSGGGRTAAAGYRTAYPVFGGLLPGTAGNAPGGAGQQQEKQRQADAQAQSTQSFHASPRV